MLRELVAQSWANLRRNPTRSLLTMLGIVWGIVAVAVLMAYGAGFRVVMMRGFDAFGKSAVVAWPGQTSEQAGGERAGRVVRIEKEDRDNVRLEATLVKSLSLESTRWRPISYGERIVNTAIRGVEPAYGELRNEVPDDGRWISPEDQLERRRVVVLGGRLREKLFAGRPAVGEIVRISGVRFTVIGTMGRTRDASVLVFSPVVPSLERQARAQVQAAIAKRQRFSPTDRRAFVMIGRQEFQPILDGITIGIQGLLLFIGTPTLTIGGVGVANIMLVAVDERVREIGLRRALGARRRHIRTQFLVEALVLTLAGGAIGILLAWSLTEAAPRLPIFGPLFEDESGQGDLELRMSVGVVLVSTLVLVVVGAVSGLVPALKASRLDSTRWRRSGTSRAGSGAEPPSGARDWCPTLRPRS